MWLTSSWCAPWKLARLLLLNLFRGLHLISVFIYCDLSFIISLVLSVVKLCFFILFSLFRGTSERRTWKNQHIYSIILKQTIPIWLILNRVSGFLMELIIPPFKQNLSSIDVLIGFFNGKNDAYKNCLEKITLIPNLFGTVEETVILCKRYFEN